MNDTSNKNFRTVAADLNHSRYDEEYFENGVVTGVSGYINYRWIPDLTLPMSHYLIKQLKIEDGATVLDFGCAKGFLVKALRLLGVEAYGVDVSEYAISQVPAEVAKYCRLIIGCADAQCFSRKYDWLISKDVFEHIPETDLRILLENATGSVKNIFVAVPLGRDDVSNKFIIPAYDNDVTHITIKSEEWWHRLFVNCGWDVVEFHYTFKGLKENWTAAWSNGNGFYVLKRRKPLSAK